MSSAARAFIVTANLYRPWPNNSGQGLLCFRFLWAWKIAALVAEVLPRAPLTRNQVELMQIDNVVSLAFPGFEALGIVPTGIEEFLAAQGTSTSR